MIKDLPVSYNIKNMHVGREVEYYNKTFHVDENIVDLMFHLWDHDFTTYACCSGGIPDNENFTRYEEVRNNFHYNDTGYIAFHDTVDFQVFNIINDILFTEEIFDSYGIPQYRLTLEKQINSNYKKVGHPISTILRWNNDSFHYVKSILMGIGVDEVVLID